MSEVDRPGDRDERLAAVIHELAHGADLDTALDPALRAAADDVGAGVVLVAAVDDDRSRLHFLYGIGLSEADVAAVELSTEDLADPIVGAAVERRIVDSPDVSTDRPTGALAERMALAHVRALPLVVGHDGIDQAVGVLVLGWTADGEVGAGTPGFLAAIADLAAIAVDRSHLATTHAERAEWHERLSQIDPLTGLANRRTFDRVLELELARAGRQQSEVSLLVFDVDAFRATNEAHGAEGGDRVLRAVGAVLAEQVRLVDTIARIGGDEFVIVAPGSAGRTVALRVLEAIRALEPVNGEPITVSAGVARFPVDGVSSDELLSAALAALGAARNGGRGAIVEAVAPA